MDKYRQEIYIDGKLIEVFDNRVLEEEKALKISEVKEFAKELLTKTDWRITRASEREIAVESDIIEEREAIRTASNKAEDIINACNELLELDQCQWMKCFG